MINYFNHTLTI